MCKEVDTRNRSIFQTSEPCSLKNIGKVCVAEEVLGRLKEDTQRRKERQFHNLSKKANGSTHDRIPKETNDSIWNFLLMVLFQRRRRNIKPF